MKAAICYEFGKPLVIEEVTVDPPQKGEVKVRIAATAICHSDIHSIRGEHGAAKLPAVPGHEVAGYVEEVAEGVTQVKVGDPVIMPLAKRGCGQCYYCTIGLPNFCVRSLFPPNLTKDFVMAAPTGRYVNNKGQRITHLAGPIAGFVEYLTVSEDYLVKIPKEMPMDRAALLTCGVMTGFGAVVNRAQVKALNSVVVIGTGGVGLNAIQGAALSGALPIIAVDILDNKLEAARLFGATHTINTKKERNPIEAVYKLTSGRGADYVFLTVAGVDILRQGFMMSGARGMTVIVGHSEKDNMSSFKPSDFVRGERILTGSGGGSTRVSIDIPRLVELYLTGHLKLDELISGRYPLERINEAIESVEKGEALRNVIIF